MASKSYRYAVLWRNGSTKTAFYIRPEKDKSLSSPESVLGYIIKSTSWGGVDVNDKDKFVRDAQHGLVTIASGYNVKADDSKQWKMGDLYSSEMHSVNNFKVDVREKVLGGYTGWGWQYKICKERPLNETEMKVVKECDKIMKSQKEIDNIYYLVMLLFRSHPNIASSRPGQREDYGRYVSAIDYDTKRFITYQESQNEVDKLKDNIIDSYNKIVEVTGKKLLHKNIELPEVFVSSRFISNDRFDIDTKGNNKELASVYNELLKTGALQKFNEVHIGSTSTDYKQIPTDDSVIMFWQGDECYNNDIQIDFSKRHLDASVFEDIPDCITLGHATSKGVRVVTFLIAWGNTKTLIETLGKDNFVKYLVSKVKTNEN
jgi:hypothetical protein